MGEMSFSNKLDKCFFPAVPAPFTKKGEIHLEAQERYVSYMAEQPVTGVAIWVHTGRGLYLTEEQREIIYKTWRDGLGKEKAIICGIGAKPDKDQTENSYITKSMEMGKHALELGADALLVYPPTFYRGKKEQDEKIVEYHRKISKLGIPLILFYLYEAAGGISYTPWVLKHLFEIENVVGIKMATLDSVMTYQDVSNLVLAEYPRIKLISGEDRMLGYTLTRGASGVLVGLGAACTALQWEMVEAYFSGNYKRFFELMLKVDKLAEATFIHPMEGYIQRMLYILSLQGIIPEEAANDPYGPGVTEDEKHKIRTTLEELGQI